MTDSGFLPGVSTAHVLGRLAKAGGNEIGTGRLASGESSAARAVNCFRWFITRLGELPPLPGEQRFVYLDAAQLVKHAFGLVSDGARKKKAPYSSICSPSRI